MSNTEIVQALKDNEKPFGLMTEEMQAKVMDTDRKELQCLCINYNLPDGHNWGGGICSICEGLTYRLRPGYKEEPEVVECEVEPDDVRGLYCMDNEGEFCFLYAVTANPDFIGFKYEDETIENKIWSVPRIYRVGEGEYSICGNFDDEVLTPTAVLFEGKDNE